MPQPNRIKPDERVPFKLSKPERDLILDRTFIDPQIQRRLRFAATSGSKLIVQLTLNDIDDLAGSVAAEANHCDDAQTRRALDAVYDRLAKLEAKYTDERSEVPLAGQSETARKLSFTQKQGQYLVFIYCYTKVHGTPPGERDLQQYFRVSPPTVHDMVLRLEARGLIERSPGQARSIRLRLSRAELPDLE
jgi:DNA-binding MarR family transcriptional regulator